MPALQEALQLADRDGFGVEQEGLADTSAVLEAHDLDRARRGGVTHKTAFGWCHRVFATVSSYHDRIVLRNRVWNDEVYVNDPAYLDAMEMINNLSSWLKRYLWRFTGMDPANLQSCLDWFVYLFREHQAEDRWPKTARVVRHLMMTDAHHRSIGRWQYQPFAKPLEPLKN